jgi:hypothetical protein
MGSAYKYRVEIAISDGSNSVLSQDKKLNDAKLEEFRNVLNLSYLPGGINNRDGSKGIVHAYKMKMIRQSDGVIVSRASAPMFEIVAALLHDPEVKALYSKA